MAIISYKERVQHLYSIRPFSILLRTRCPALVNVSHGIRSRVTRLLLGSMQRAILAALALYVNRTGEKTLNDCTVPIGVTAATSARILKLKCYCVDRS